jgi:predicted nucleic acid-binding protein
MKLVVDANILFSLLIKQGKTAELFLNLSLELYAPEFLLDFKMLVNPSCLSMEMSILTVLKNPSMP